MTLSEIYKLINPIVIEYKAKNIESHQLPYDRLSIILKIHEDSIFIILDYITFDTVMWIYPNSKRKCMSYSGNYEKIINDLKQYLSK